MKTLFIALFLLLPFALSAVMPQVIIHAHEMADNDRHVKHGHHYPDEDFPENEKQASKDFKSHAHDGQVHELLQTGRVIPIVAFSRGAHFLPPLHLPPSGNIKPPLEPPTYL